MKIKSLWLLGAAVAVLACGIVAQSGNKWPSIPALKFAPNEAEYVPGEVLVKFTQQAPGPAQMAINRAIGATVAEVIPGINVQRLRLPAGITVEDAVRYYQSQPSVEFAEPNHIRRACFTPNDTYFNSQQWGPKKISCPQGWDINQGNSNIRIAIVDTGIRSTHSDLVGKVVAKQNFAGSGNLEDGYGHGTHCAGISAAVTNNANGIAGVGFNCSLINAKGLTDGGSGTDAGLANAIRWSADQGAHVLNLSWGGGGNSSTINSAIDYAWGKNAVICAAAGNNGSSSPFYPAAYATCIAVGSTTSSDTKSSFSNYGTSWVDVGAPGSTIFSTYPANTYVNMDGTSMAAPHVCGEAGLLYAHKGGSTPNSTIRSLIENNCDAILLSFFKYGRINVYKALQAAGGGGTVKTYPADSFFVPVGVLSGGTLSSLANSDNNYLTINTQQYFAVQHAWLEGMATVGTGTFNKIDVKFELNSTLTGYFVVQMYNWTTGQWDYLYDDTVGTTDFSMTMSITSGVMDYVSTSRQLKMRIARFNGNVPFKLNVDQIQFTTYE